MRSASRRLRTSASHLFLVLALVAVSVGAVAGVAVGATGRPKAATTAKAKKAAAKRAAAKRGAAKRAAAKRAAAKRAAAKRAAAKKAKARAAVIRCHTTKAGTRKCVKITAVAARRKPRTPTTTTTVPTTTTTVPTTTTTVPTTTTTTTTTTPTTTTTVPTTTTSPDATPSAGGYLGYGGLTRPGASWRPYSASSPWNQQLTSPTVHPRSAQMVSRVLGWGQPMNITAGDADTTWDFFHPVYFSRSTDPVVKLHATYNWGTAPIEGMQIPVPAGARPAAGDDGHMTIVTPDGWEYDLWRAQPASNGQLNFAWGSRIRVDGDGLRSGATAAEFGNLAGVVRPEELAAGKIEHALFIVLRCTSNTLTFGYNVQPHNATDSGGSFVYPATKGGGRCADTETDAPPMGARFQLNMTDAQIQALAVPAWKKTVLTALAHYGGYVGDTGGSGFGIQFESGSSFTSYGKADPFVTYAQQNGVPAWEGKYVYNIASGVNWGQYLRVVTPPSAG